MLCSCKLRLRRDEPDGRLTQRPSSSSWPPSASCRRGQDLQLQRPCCGSVFLPPQGGGRKERAGAGSSSACFVASSYASAGTSPTVGLPSAHRALLGLRRLHAGGAKTCSYRGHVAGLFFSAARRRKRTTSWGRSHERPSSPSRG